MNEIDKYLEILELDKNFKYLSKQEQEKALAIAWRKFSRKWHPDINKSQNAEKMFKSGNKANEKLKECIQTGCFESNGDDYQDYQDNYDNNYWYNFTKKQDDVSNAAFKKTAATVAIIFVSLFLIFASDSSASSNNQTQSYNTQKPAAENSYADDSEEIAQDEEYDEESYIEDLKNDIGYYWNPDDSDKTMETKVLFHIAKDGNLIDRKVETSSGDDDFDNTAISAIDMSAPFAPLPDDFEEEEMPVELTFKYD